VIKSLQRFHTHHPFITAVCFPFNQAPCWESRLRWFSFFGLERSVPLVKWKILAFSALGLFVFLSLSSHVLQV